MSGSRRGATRQTRYLLLFVSPWLIGFTFLVIGPMMVSLYLSMTDYSITKPPRWIGLHNYRSLFRGWDPDFYNSIKVTAAYTVVYVPLVVVGALLIAALLNVKTIRGIGFYRTLFFLPALMPAVASAIIWAWVFDPKYGWLNTLYSTLCGSPGPDWLQDPRLALSCIILMSAWGGIGYPMLIFLAGLQGVSRPLLEAAVIDGANGWNRFRHVVIPQISPLIFFNLVMGTVGALQIFTAAFVFGQANAVNRKATQFYVIHIYEQAFGSSRFGLACALAWLLLVVVVVLTTAQFVLKKRWVHYDD